MAKEDPEIRAMKRVERALMGLDAAEKQRVLRFVQERLVIPMVHRLAGAEVRGAGTLPPAWTAPETYSLIAPRGGSKEE